MCSKIGMLAFGQAYLSCEKFSYVKVVHVNGLANKFDKFDLILDLQTPH